jgi:preprotein translocase subunit SecG
MDLPQSNVIGGQSAAVKGIINVANFGVQLWKLCLILALVFLATEILLVRFYKTDKGTITKSAEL